MYLGYRLCGPVQNVLKAPLQSAAHIPNSLPKGLHRPLHRLLEVTRLLLYLCMRVSKASGHAPCVTPILASSSAFHFTRLALEWEVTQIATPSHLTIQSTTDNASAAHLMLCIWYWAHALICGIITANICCRESTASLTEVNRRQQWDEKLA